MATIETVNGTIVYLERRAAASGEEVLEFDVSLADGNSRRVQTLAAPDIKLREGDAVTVVGQTDANGIVRAQTIAPIPPAVKRSWPLWILTLPPVAWFTELIVEGPVGPFMSPAEVLTWIAAGIAIGIAGVYVGRKKWRRVGLV